MRKEILFILATALTTVVACGDKPPAKVPAPPLPPPMSVPVDKPFTPRDQIENPAQINISDEIQKACGISNADAHFAFDSAKIESDDYGVLNTLATCFATGALAGRQMRLVGHTDPRGDEEYNYVLGERRATSVGKYLEKKGMKSSQVTTSSQGKLHATGTTEAGWAKDRRVDVLLGQ